MFSKCFLHVHMYVFTDTVSISSISKFLYYIMSTVFSRNILYTCLSRKKEFFFIYVVRKLSIRAKGEHIRIHVKDRLFTRNLTICFNLNTRQTSSPCKWYCTIATYTLNKTLYLFFFIIVDHTWLLVRKLITTYLNSAF